MSFNPLQIIALILMVVLGFLLIPELLKNK